MIVAEQWHRSINVIMKDRKRIALVAHDERKQDLLEWAAHNAKILQYIQRKA